MAINFPNSPVSGSTYTYNHITYVYNQSGSDEGYWSVNTPGTVGIATAAEIDAGTNVVKYVTPAQLSLTEGWQDLILLSTAVDSTATSNQITITNTEATFAGDASVAGIVEILGGSVKLNGATMSGIQVVLADDAAAELTFPNRTFGMLNLTEGNNNDVYPDTSTVFMGYVDFGTSPNLQQLLIGLHTRTNLNVALTGQTGTDWKLTIGLGGVSGTLYIENRRGSARVININLL